MAKRLLDRQVELLEYLTSSAAIFAGGDAGSSAPSGFDPELLRLEARFSHDKRLEKVRAVFDRTFVILGASLGELTREFAEACPPTSPLRRHNARQFHVFLSERWQRVPAEPAYLPDVAAVELARFEASAAARRAAAPKFGVRRAVGVRLLRCAFDVRPVFEAEHPAVIPAARETRLAIVMQPGLPSPLVLELLPVVFDLLAALDAPVDPACLGPPGTVAPLFAELFRVGLIEGQA